VGLFLKENNDMKKIEERKAFLWMMFFVFMAIMMALICLLMAG